MKAKLIHQTFEGPLLREELAMLRAEVMNYGYEQWDASEPNNTADFDEACRLANDNDETGKMGNYLSRIAEEELAELHLEFNQEFDLCDPVPGTAQFWFDVNSRIENGYWRDEE